MSKKSSWRGHFGKQHGKRAKAQLKSASQHLYHIRWSLPRQLKWQKSLLLTCKILVLLVNTLAANKMYPLPITDNLTIPIQMILSRKQKLFSQFFEMKLKFYTFWKKDDPHRFCISEITDSENVVRSMSNKSDFRGPFDKQHSKRAKALLKCSSVHLYHIHWSLPSQLSWQKSLLLTFKILGLLLNTLAAVEKYPVLNRDNLTIPIQVQASQKQKTFFSISGCIFESYLTFWIFWKKRWPS